MQTQTERLHNLEHGGKFRIVFRGKRSVKTDAADSGLAGDRCHPLCTGNIPNGSCNNNWMSILHGCCKIIRHVFGSRVEGRFFILDIFVKVKEVTL
jgi:hypothetical protein